MTLQTTGISQGRRLPIKPLAAVNAFEELAETSMPRVLIVDDDPGVVRAVSMRCRRLGLEVMTAEGGLQAILKTRHLQPDIMIVDIGMPEVDGFKVCERLLSSRRPGMNVIVLTGSTDNETTERCEAIGAYYVPKTGDAWNAIQAILVDLLGLEPAVSDGLPPRPLPVKEDDVLPTAGARILVVDDDLDVVTALRSRLRKMKATVFVADNGIDAYRTALREEPHAIITDYLMPHGGGHYLIWRLRERKETATLPIFVMSGEIETPERPLPRVEDLIGPRTATGVFRKPFEFDAIASALKAYCPIMRS